MKLKDFFFQNSKRDVDVLEAIKTLDVVFSSKLRINFSVATLSCQVKVTDWDFILKLGISILLYDLESCNCCRILQWEHTGSSWR